MSKVYEIAFQMGGQITSTFQSTMRGANAALGDLQKHINAVNNQAADVGRLQKLQRSVGELSREYTEAQQTAQRLGRQLAETENPTKKQRQEFDRARQSAATLKTKLSEQRGELQRLRTSLDAAGQGTRELTARQKELVAQAERARQAQANLQKTMAAQQANIANRQNLRGQLFDATALAVTLAAPIKIAAEFEQSMAKVGAVSRASDKELAALTKTARDLGATTNWTASQAAEGMQYLSMAGFSTNQTIAAMPGMLDLASAGAIDLGQAADIASNVLSGFNMEAEQMGRLGDVLTNTFTSSNTNLQMLGETMAYVAPVAAATGVSLEETAAMAGKLGDAGIQGGKAGTALRAVISRLSAPVGKASAALESLGIKTQDASGNLRPVPEILAEMQEAMGDLGTAAKQEIISTVFGLEAASAATVLLGQAGSGSLQKYTQTLYETGSATRVANKQNETAMGAMRRMGSAVESLAITFGNVLLPPLADLADMLAQGAGLIDSFAQQFPMLTKVVVIGTAALMSLKISSIALGYAWTFVKGGALQLQKVLQTMRVVWLLNSGAVVQYNNSTAAAIKINKAMSLSMGALNKSFKLTGLSTLATTVLPMLTTAFASLGAAIMATPIGWIAAGVAALVVGAIAIYKYWEPIKAFFSGFWAGLKEGFTAAFSGIVEGFKPVIEAVQPVIELFKQFAPVISPLVYILGAVWDQVKALAGWLGSLFKQGEYTKESLDSVSESGRNFGNIIATAFSVVLLPVQLFIKAIGGVVSAFGALAKWLSGFSLSEIVDGIIDGVKWSFMNLTPMGWAIQAFTAAKDWLSGFSLTEVTDEIITGVKWAFMNLTPMGWAIQAFNAAKRWLSGFSLSGAAAKVINTIKSAFRLLNPVSWITGAFNQVKSWLSRFSLFSSGKAIISTLASGIRSAASSVISSVTNVFKRVRNLLPFSDAKEGPLSELTKSGAAIMETLAQGASQTPELQKSIANQLQAANQSSGLMSATAGVAASDSSSGGMVIHVTVEQNITVDGGGDVAGIRESVAQGARQGVASLRSQLEQLMSEKRRLSYA